MQRAIVTGFSAQANLAMASALIQKGVKAKPTGEDSTGELTHGAGGQIRKQAVGYSISQRTLTQEHNSYVYIKVLSQMLNMLCILPYIHGWLLITLRRPAHVLGRPTSGNTIRGTSWG